MLVSAVCTPSGGNQALLVLRVTALSSTAITHCAATIVRLNSAHASAPFDWSERAHGGFLSFALVPDAHTEAHRVAHTCSAHIITHPPSRRPCHPHARARARLRAPNRTPAP